jgi:hypothetical protein
MSKRSLTVTVTVTAAADAHSVEVEHQQQAGGRGLTTEARHHTISGTALAPPPERALVGRQRQAADGTCC